MRRRAIPSLILVGIVAVLFAGWYVIRLAASHVQKTAIYEPMMVVAPHAHFFWIDNQNLLNLRPNAHGNVGVYRVNAFTGEQTTLGSGPYLDLTYPLVALSPDGKRILYKSGSSLRLGRINNLSPSEVKEYRIGSVYRFTWLDADRWAMYGEDAAGKPVLQVYNASTPDAPPGQWNSPTLKDTPYILGFNPQGEAIAVDHKALYVEACIRRQGPAALGCFLNPGSTIRFLRFNPVSPSSPTATTIRLPARDWTARFALSPDGTKIAWAARLYLQPDLMYHLQHIYPRLLFPTRTLLPNARDSLWISDADGTNFRLLTEKTLSTVSASNVQMPFWTPDGEYIGYWRENQLYRVSIR